MMHKLVAVLVICTVLLVGCSPLVYYPDLSIQMERGPCAGGCPVYQLAIDADGNVIYEGEQYVAIEGKRSAKIIPQQIKALVDAIKESQVFDLYLEREAATGLPSVALSVTLNGRSRRLQNIGFRDCLGQWQPCELEHKIDVIVNSDQWVKPMSKPTSAPRALKPRSDFGILSQEPCGPPCFQGITPGVTTFADARVIMKNADEQCEEHTYRIEAGAPGSMSLNCKLGDAEIGIFGEEHGKTTVMVEQIYLKPPLKLTVGELIAQYGPPDWLVPRNLGGYGSEAMSMEFFYDRLETWIVLSTQPRYPYTITPDTTIYAVYYNMDQGYWYRRLDGYLDKLWSHESVFSVTNLGRPWKGYGAY